MKLINKYKFTNAIIDKNLEIFMVYIVALKGSKITIYLFWANQILSKIIQLAIL